MYPFIQEGDICCFRRIGDSEPKPGQVVLFKAPQGLVGHRLIRRPVQAGDGAGVLYQFKGDTNYFCDALVAADSLIGILDSLTRRGRHVTMDSWVRKVWSLVVVHVSKYTRLVRIFMDWQQRLHGFPAKGFK